MPDKNFTLDVHILRNLYETSPLMLRTVDLNGIILFCNPQYANKLGYPIEEIIGKSIFESVALKSQSDFLVLHKNWKKTGFISPQEIWLQKKDGTVFPTLFSVSNLYASDGKLIGSNTSIQDISEIYKFKNEIVTLKKQRMDILGELCIKIAHDFKNPIQTIQSAISLMEHKENLDEDTIKIHEMIKKATFRLSHQINDVLDFVNPPTLEIQNHSILAILKKMISNVIIPETITLAIPENDIRIDCDQYQIEAVFANLFLNAMQAMNNVGTIDIQIKDENYFVLIEIQDSGPGIPSDLLDKIFDPLFTTRQIGTGLGLPSCRNIVENHGGMLDVSTVLGMSTTFSIRLPKKQHFDR